VFRVHRVATSFKPEPTALLLTTFVSCLADSFRKKETFMLTIKRVEPSGTCVFCSKEKEVAAVVMDDGQQEVLLCWADIKKHAQMRMRMNGQPEKKPSAITSSSNLSAKS